MPNFFSAQGAAQSSKSMEWETPQSLFDSLNTEFSFDLDAAASHENAKCSDYCTEVEDGLKQPWLGRRVWLNPPYGREIGKWVEKAYRETKDEYCQLCVLLIPARTDTKYWHDFIFNKADDIRFLRGRLKFELDGQPMQSAPFPSAIVVYRRSK